MSYVPDTVPEHGTNMSLLSVSLPSFKSTFTVALDVDALLDLFTLRPCTDLVTLGVGGMSLLKLPVRAGNLIDASLFSSSELT